MDNFRVIGVIDVDSFECQVWQREHPKFRDTACVVSDSSGRIVSVSPEAKKKGVTRDMRRNQAENICNGLKVFVKPNRYNKPDSKMTRDASWEIMTAIRQFCADKPEIIIEYTPNDQWVFDLTKHVENLLGKNPAYAILRPCVKKRNSLAKDKILKLILESSEDDFSKKKLYHKIFKDFIHHSDLNLIDNYAIEDEHAFFVGALVLRDICLHILRTTKFFCSGGIGVNQVQAKIGCQKNKPKSITILTEEGFERISDTYPIQEIPGLKNNRGRELIICFPDCETLHDFRQHGIEDFADFFGYEDAQIIYDSVHGVCTKPVIEKIDERWIELREK